MGVPLTYVTMILALVLAYQTSAPEWSDSGWRGPWSSVVVLSALAVMWLVPRVSFSGLRLGWALGGLLLSAFALRAIIRGQSHGVPLLLVWIDAAGAWAALALTGAPALAVWAGATAGSILPAALDPLPRRFIRVMRPLAVVITGAAGLRFLLKAITGAGLVWPLGLVAIPWLILWDAGAGFWPTTE